MTTVYNIISPTTSKSVIQPNAFLKSVETHFQRVLKYENPDLLTKAKLCIPLESLQLRAVHRMREIQINIKKGLTNELDMQLSDAILLELMSWFKFSFFKWVDKPPCRKCEGATKYSHSKVALTKLESVRVEIFKCYKCRVTTDFPRFNDPAVLLQTRRGRCGEWANCFALLCRALEYDTRFIMDTTDHVWVEVYSFTNKKWLHCDPCENILDSPLLYEAGWGKKLEYVMAYSKDDIQDVTWRYTSDHKATLQRRNRCTEQELLNLIMYLRNQRWEKLTAARRKFVCKRLCAEIVELMIERKASNNEMVGRSSGSLSWRLQRRETKPWSPHVWKYTDQEEICIRYSSSLDLYEAVLPDGTVIETIKQWMNGAFDIHNIIHKEESDWRMVYLAREASNDDAKLTWKIITYLNISIDSVQIKASSTTFESGNVDWVVTYGDNCQIIPKSEESDFSLTNLDDVKEITLSANLSGGEGSLAWQHSQVFRQEMGSPDYPLQIIVKFKSEHTDHPYSKISLDDSY